MTYQVSFYINDFEIHFALKILQFLSLIIVEGLSLPWYLKFHYFEIWYEIVKPVQFKTDRRSSFVLIDLENELFVGHQSAVSGEVMLRSFDLDRRSGHWSEGQLLQVLQDALVKTGVDLLQAGGA